MNRSKWIEQVEDVDSLFGRMSVFEAEDLDAEMSRYGLLSVVPTETLTRGWRVTVYGVYRKQTPASSSEFI